MTVRAKNSSAVDPYLRMYIVKNVKVRLAINARLTKNAALFEHASSTWHPVSIVP
jgi:hypothetical protein